MLLFPFFLLWFFWFTSTADVSSRWDVLDASCLSEEGSEIQEAATLQSLLTGTLTCTLTGTLTNSFGCDNIGEINWPDLCTALFPLDTTYLEVEEDLDEGLVMHVGQF